MGFFRTSERGIGRGETAESRIEFPFFAGFMVVCAVILLILHLRVGNQSLTAAAAISMIVFGMTVLRVDFGIYILAVAMLLSPEIGAGNVSTGERSINVRYDDVLIAVIFMGVLVKVAFEGRETFWLPSPINVGIVVYMTVCFAATLLALRANLPAWDRQDALFVFLKMMEFYMIFFMVGNAVRTLKEVRRQLFVFFAVAMVVCIYGIHSIGTIDRVGAPFEREGAEPNTLGGYLVLVTCIAASLYTQAPNWKKKLLFLGLAGMAFFPFLFTLSRASYLAMIVSMTAVGIFGRKFLIVGLVAAILFLSPILMPTEVKDRVNYTFQRGSGEKVVINGNDTGLQVDKSTYERIYVWEKVKFTLSVAPWFGGGISWGRVLDSQYARVLMESGLFGMVAFVFLLIRILIASRQAAKWTRDWVGRGVAIGVTAATIGLAVHSMGTISFLIVRIMEPFWLLTALCCVVRQDAIMDYARRVEEARVKRAEAARRARAATEAADSEATPTLVHPVANVTVPHPGAYIAPQGYTLR